MKAITTNDNRPPTATWSWRSNNSKCCGSCLILWGLWSPLDGHKWQGWVSSCDKTILLSIICFRLWDGSTSCSRSWKPRDRLDSGPDDCLRMKNFSFHSFMWALIFSFSLDLEIKRFFFFFPHFCDVWGQNCVLQCKSWSLKVSGEEDVCLLILQFPPALWMNNRQAPETGPHPPLEPTSHWLSSSPNVFTVRTSAQTEGACSSVACLEMRSELESSFPGVYLHWCLGAALAYFAFYFLSL